MPLETSYTARPAGSAAGAHGQSTDKLGDYWPLSKLRKCYTDYLFSKREEIDEQIDARRYYHGSQYTNEQINALRKRKQPIMTFNRVNRKIDGVVGQIEGERQDPKAYPRTPEHQEGAELGTAAIRYVLDSQEWEAKSAICTMTAAVDGIGGVERDLIQGDQGDPDIEVNDVEIDCFFYDPRSHRADFSDARYMGVGKWLDKDIATDMFPDADESAFSSDDELTSNSDREARWFRSEGVNDRVRVVECWYKHKGDWCWAVFSGNSVLKEGQSPFKDEKGKGECKYVMFSGSVDQDGDRYGFVRNLKSPQDGINAKQSKMQHILASKRLFISQGAVDDIEKTRAEMARPDGVVVTNRPVNEGIKTDDQTFDFAGWVKMLELNQAEIENFGPNRTLLSEGGVDSRSGRAIAMLRQSGMAELGPFILSHRGWKIRVYRSIWNMAQQHWKAERWIRVTDDEGLAQHIKINQMQIDPTTMQPTLVNAIGSLDVDIILDEAPDSINMMQDFYETLQQVLPAVAPMLAPPKATAMVDMLIESSPMAADQKKKYRDAGKDQPPQPDPQVAVEQAKLELKAKEAEQNIALKAQEAEAERVFRHEQIQTDFAIEMQKIAAKAEADRQALLAKRQAADEDREAKRQTDEQQLAFDLIALEKQGEVQVAIAREKGAVETQCHTEKMNAEDERDKRRVETEAKVSTEKAKDPSGAATAKAIEGLTKAFLAPTKLITDKDGHPVGAKKVL